MLVKIVSTKISIDEILNSVRSPRSGAVVLFLGTARERSWQKGENPKTAAARQVLRLEYEAYQPMAQKELLAVVQEMKRKWQLDDVAIVHRTGVVELGEPSVAIAVASAHRAEAFEACRFAIEEIKKKVPIWKKEYFEDGSAWVDEG